MRTMIMIGGAVCSAAMVSCSVGASIYAHDAAMLSAEYRVMTLPVREQIYVGPRQCIIPTTLREEPETWQVEQSPGPQGDSTVYGRDVIELSRADDGTAHGHKVYRLRATDPQAYIDAVGGGSPPAQGFSVIKEAFHPVDVGEFAPLYTLGDHAGLFIMTKHADDVPGTDRGWVYSTAVPSEFTIEGDVVGWEVTASGRIASCMGCHENAPHGRLFGLGVNTVYGDVESGFTLRPANNRFTGDAPDRAAILRE